MKIKLTLLFLITFLISCKNDTEKQIETLNNQVPKVETQKKKTKTFEFEKFKISKGKIGNIKIGMNIIEAEKELNELTKKEAEAYDFGYGGGGKAFIYSIQNEPILALIPHRDTAEILALIAISHKLKTDNGLNPNSNIIDILKRYPKMEVSQDLMTEHEYMYDENKKWSFIFLTDESNRIGEYKDIEEPTKPNRIETKMDYIEIK
jgi:hypothetical protein